MFRRVSFGPMVSSLVLPGPATCDWTVVGWAVGGAAIILLVAVLQGTAFGLALLNTPAAVVSFFALPTAVNGVNLLIPSWETFFSWTDINTTMIPFFVGIAPTGDEWAKFAVSAAIWIALPMAIGVWRVLHREVK